MRSIELVFDQATESLVRADWARLAAAGIPSLAGHTAASNRPHLTLAAGPELSLPADTGRLRQMLPLGVELSGAQVFPAGRGTYVLARSVAGGALLDLHRQLHARLSGALPLTLPDAWTPHVTLARRVRGDQVGTALDLLDLRLPGVCTGARLWDSATRTITGLG